MLPFLCSSHPNTCASNRKRKIVCHSIEPLSVPLKWIVKVSKRILKMSVETILRDYGDYDLVVEFQLYSKWPKVILNLVDVKTFKLIQPTFEFWSHCHAKGEHITPFFTAKQIPNNIKCDGEWKGETKVIFQKCL